MNKYYFDVKLFGYIELINKNNVETINISESIIDIHPNIKNKRLVKK